MKRRNFIVASLAFATTIKTLAAKTKMNLSSAPSKLDIDELLSQKIIYLKRNEIVKLPEGPTPIETIIHFSTKKYRFGKSPIIEVNGQRVDGNLIEQLVLTKDIALNNKTEFYMQYTGSDIGWIILI